MALVVSGAPPAVSLLQAELAAIADEERRLAFGAFSNEDGIALGLAVLAAARAGGHAVAVEVRRFAGQQVVFHGALDGALPDFAHWIARKARVVERFHRSSFGFGREMLLKGKTLADYALDEREYAAHGGGFPITVVGAGVVGAVVVSGLPQAEDHRLVVSVLEAFLAARGGR
jgi:uncharacterized protein (UPF0303 family)